MSSGVRYFFDLPVYRVSESEYYEQQQKYIDRFLSRSNATILIATRDD